MSAHAYVRAAESMRRDPPRVSALLTGIELEWGPVAVEVCPVAAGRGELEIVGVLYAGAPCAAGAGFVPQILAPRAAELAAIAAAAHDRLVREIVASAV